MIAPACAEPAIVAVQGRQDRYVADQAWIAEGMVHALGRWQHVETSGTRLYGELCVRSWPTHLCTVEWSPQHLLADVLSRQVEA
jgi:hypothetical protein